MSVDLFTTTLLVHDPLLLCLAFVPPVPAPNNMRGAEHETYNVGVGVDGGR